LKPMKVGAIHLYSTGLPADQWPLTGVQRAESVEVAIAASVERSGDRSLAVIPEGPYVVPQYRAATSAPAASGKPALWRRFHLQ
jgi:lactate racemase